MLPKRPAGSDPEEPVALTLAIVSARSLAWPAVVYLMFTTVSWDRPIS
jgi:hypothetical protein